MKIECTFDTKIFHNPMNKYCIFRMKTDDPLIPKEARGDRIYPDHLIRFSAVGYELPMTDVVKLVLEGDWVPNFSMSPSAGTASGMTFTSKRAASKAR